MNVNNYFELSEDFALTIHVGDVDTIDLIVSAYALDELQDELGKFLKSQAGNIVDINNPKNINLKKLNMSKMLSEKEIMFNLLYENPTNKKNIDKVMKTLQDNQKKALKNFIGEYAIQSLQYNKEEDLGK